MVCGLNCFDTFWSLKDIDLVFPPFLFPSKLLHWQCETLVIVTETVILKNDRDEEVINESHLFRSPCHEKVRVTRASNSDEQDEQH